MKKIAIYGNPRQNGYISRIADFLRTLEAADTELWLYDEFGTWLRRNGVTGSWRQTAVLPDDVWRLVSIGGDGTFLRTARWAGKSQVPILGINTGHLGFLASYSFDETDELLHELLEGGGKIEPRMVLRLHSDSLPEGIWPYALNEVAILKCDTASMLTARTWIDSHYLADYLADGLIMATPTGSTAYNLSVGGPIIEPTVENIVLSPVAPHSLTMRPLVVGGKSTVDVAVFSKPKRCRISIDGRAFSIKCDSGATQSAPTLRVTKADFHVNILRRPDSDFADILRKKLLWGQR